MVKYDDIAKLAKVSITTVSHVINKTRYVLILAVVSGA